MAKVIYQVDVVDAVTNLAATGELSPKQALHAVCQIFDISEAEYFGHVKDAIRSTLDECCQAGNSDQVIEHYRCAQGTLENLLELLTVN
jgi:hypothetical protein